MARVGHARSPSPVANQKARAQITGRNGAKGTYASRAFGCTTRCSGVSFSSPVPFINRSNRDDAAMGRSSEANRAPVPVGVSSAQTRSLFSASYWLRGLPSAAITALLIVLFTLLWRAAELFEYSNHASLWFAPHGLLVAMLLLWKRDGAAKVWLAVFLQPLGIRLMGGGSMDLAGGQWEQAAHATVHTFAYWVGVRAFCAVESRSGRTYPSNVLLPIVFAIFMFGASLLSSVLGSLVHLGSGEFSPQEAQAVWLARWIGNLVGVITLTPLFVLLGVRLLPRFVDPHDTMLVVNACSARNRRVRSAWPCWSMTLALALMPFLLLFLQTYGDPKLPVSFLFLFSLFKIEIYHCC